MCGIVGYIGNENAAPILLEGLKKLEYRGYDSAGIAVQSPSNTLQVVKAKGKLTALEDLVCAAAPEGTVGIGHSRWATHGEPSVVNAHPHYNSDRTIAVVHNGIIENYAELKERLQAWGYLFLSKTDTEVVAHLLDYYYKKLKDPAAAISTALTRLKGSYALGILFADYPDTVFAARNESPLVVGIGKGCHFIASDAPAILKHTRDVIYIDNFEIAVIGREFVTVYDLDLEVVHKEVKRIEWDVEAAEKGGFEHFMLKEIYEQPTAIRNTLSPRIKEGKTVLDELGMTEEELKALKRVYIVACGSAYHAGAVMKTAIERLARLPVEVDIASEFRYRDPILEKDSICIVISQSGETADSLAALRKAKAEGLWTVGIVNVIGSSIARESDSVLYTYAGPEISVATTKAYSAQVALGYLLAIHLASVRGVIDGETASRCLAELQRIPDLVTEILGDKESIQRFAVNKAIEKDIYFIGRREDHAAALEASLKLKEISYIHSEAYAAGELKHGTISLVEKGTLVVSLATQPDLYEKTVSNTAEVISRGAEVFALTFGDNCALTDMATFTVTLPAILPVFATLLAVVPMQLFAYYVSLAKGLDVDKPRNLAKSVTVE